MLSDLAPLSELRSAARAVLPSDDAAKRFCALVDSDFGWQRREAEGERKRLAIQRLMKDRVDAAIVSGMKRGDAEIRTLNVRGPSLLRGVDNPLLDAGAVLRRFRQGKRKGFDHACYRRLSREEKSLAWHEAERLLEESPQVRLEAIRWRIQWTQIRILELRGGVLTYSKSAPQKTKGVCLVATLLRYLGIDVSAHFVAKELQAVRPQTDAWRAQSGIGVTVASHSAPLSEIRGAPRPLHETRAQQLAAKILGLLSKTWEETQEALKEKARERSAHDLNK